MSLKFTPDMFHRYYQNNKSVCSAGQAAEMAQEIFDKWLNEQPVIYSHYSPPSPSLSYWGIHKEHADTHTARLVDIREIKAEKCEHINISQNLSGRFSCAKCKKELKPNWTEI